MTGTNGEAVGWLIARLHSSAYLERIPYDGTFRFLAGAQRYATVFSYDAAVAMQATLAESTTLIRDYRGRTPEIVDVAAVTAGRTT